MAGITELYDSNHAGSVTTITPAQKRAAGVNVAARAVREGWDRELLTEQLEMLGLLDQPAGVAR